MSASFPNPSGAPKYRPAPITGVYQITTLKVKRVLRRRSQLCKSVAVWTNCMRFIWVRSRRGGVVASPNPPKKTPSLPPIKVKLALLSNTSVQGKHKTLSILMIFQLGNQKLEMKTQAGSLTERTGCL